MKTHQYFTHLAVIMLMLLASVNLYSQSVGDPAPDFTLSDDQGSSFRLSDHQGKVVFIFLFGYACPHCLGNGNNTETGVYDVYKNNSDFVAVGVDTWDGNAQGVASFKSSTGITYSLCYMGSSLEATYSTTYDRMVVVDKDGIIRYKSNANSTSDVVSAASDVIKSLLNPNSIFEGKRVEKNALTVYPVPANNEVLVKLPENDKKASIRIMNINGQVVYDQAVQENSLIHSSARISVDFLPEGLYVVDYLTDENSYTAKLVINREQ